MDLATALPACFARELPDDAPFWERDVTLAVVIGGEVLQSHRVGEKLELLKVADRADLVLAAWHGRHSSAIFTVPHARVAAEQARRRA